MCKCAKSLSFWGTLSPKPLCPWTSLRDFRPRTSLLAIVYSRPLWREFPPPKKIRNPPPDKFDKTEESEARIHALPYRTKSLDFLNLAASPQTPLGSLQLSPGPPCGFKGAYF